MKLNMVNSNLLQLIKDIENPITYDYNELQSEIVRLKIVNKSAMQILKDRKQKSNLKLVLREMKKKCLI